MKKYKRLVSPARSSSPNSLLLSSPVKRNKDDDLYKYNQHCCEFCDAVFYNKYGILIHNARHIIIPLQNQTIYQCNVCLFHFTSQEELLFHSATKHGITSSQVNKKKITKKSLAKEENAQTIDVDKKSLSKTNVDKKSLSKTESIEDITKKIATVATDLEITKKSASIAPAILESIINSKARISCDNTINQLITNKSERDLECLVEKQPVIRCEDTFKELLKSINEDVADGTSSEKDKKKYLKRLKKKQKKRRDKKKNSSKNKSDLKLGIPNGGNTYPDVIKPHKAVTNEEFSIKNKIVFEDDDDVEFIDDIVIADETVTQTTRANTSFVQTINIDKPSSVNQSASILQTKDLDLDAEILDLCDDDDDDEEEKSCEDYILPDNNDYIVKRIIVPDNSYILPDSDPEFIIPDKESEIQPLLNGTGIQNEKLKAINGMPVQNKPSTSIGIPFNNLPFFGKIVLGTKVTQDSKVSSTVEFRPSVHYEDLLAPGLYGCRRCKLKFPDRYHLISHEKRHITIRPRIYAAQANNCPICDRYIAGNYHSLRRHIKQRHPDTPERSYSLSLCKKCGLRYRNYTQHERNYHYVLECQRCGHKFDSDIDRRQHVQQMKCVEKKAPQDVLVDHKTVKLLKVCELCSLFMKVSTRQRIEYIVCGETSKLGKRQKCEKCQKPFFELKLVKRIHKWKSCDDTNTVNDSKKKNPSNNSRLKSMQHRLKMFNKLSQ